MQKNFIYTLIILSAVSIILPDFVYCQSKTKLENYLLGLPKHLQLDNKTPQKYLMTSEYFNKDIYGNFWSKIKITGEYIRGLENGYVSWNNVFISHANKQSESYLESAKQDYMENITYIPSSRLLEESFFENFEKYPDNFFARNLIWDMMAIESYAWNYFDSLHLNNTYIVPDIHGSFKMADIGTYNHKKIELNRIGISMMNNKLCAIIEYRALDNKLEIHTDKMKSKGSEFYWGKTWISLENKQIEYAEMYSNTIQEMDIQGLPEKILVSTKRVLTLEKIKQH
jgi:hypothetical protein